MTIKHIQGAENVAADWLSRGYHHDKYGDSDIQTMSAPTCSVEDAKEQNLIAPYVPSPEQFKESYGGCPMSELNETVEGQDGLKYHFRSNKLYVPPPLREAMLYWFHASMYGGHLGIGRTQRRVGKFVWWPGLSKDVQSLWALVRW